MILGAIKAPLGLHHAGTCAAKLGTKAVAECMGMIKSIQNVPHVKTVTIFFSV